MWSPTLVCLTITKTKIYSIKHFCLGWPNVCSELDTRQLNAKILILYGTQKSSVACVHGTRELLTAALIHTWIARVKIRQVQFTSCKYIHVYWRWQMMIHWRFQTALKLTDVTLIIGISQHIGNGELVQLRNYAPHIANREKACLVISNKHGTIAITRSCAALVSLKDIFPNSAPVTLDTVSIQTCSVLYRNLN